MKRIILLLFATVLFVHAGQAVYACNCTGVKGPVLDANGQPAKIDWEQVRKWWLEEFKGAIFVGKVAKVEKVKVNWFDRIVRMKEVTVNVERAWLGVNSSSFVIYTNLGKGGDCGVNYTKGERYFFYADFIGGLLETNACSPQQPENEMLNAFKAMLGDGRSFSN